MKCYVASRFNADGKRVTRDLHERLTAAGHSITHDWTDEDKGDDPSECALRDFDGVWDADVLVMVPFPFCRGTWVELGIALARFLPVCVVDINRDPSSWCVFEHVPGVHHVDSLHAAVEWVNELHRASWPRLHL